MLRDLFIGGVLGVTLWGWRTFRSTAPQEPEPSDRPVAPPDSIDPAQKIKTLQQQLSKTQKALAIAVAKRAEAETQVSELNQLATDRAIELVQLQADSAELLAQVAQLSQKRTRKKRTPKAEVSPDPLLESLSEGSTELSAAIPTDLTAGLPTELPTESLIEPPIEPEVTQPVLERVPNAEPLTLDLSLIHQKQAETAVASQLLQTVFTETAAETDRSGVAQAHSPTVGLDLPHTEFLKALSQQSNWDRHDLLALAQSHGLMLDGALEAINDAALDQCDEPLMEGDDPITLDPVVLRELLV